jgi:phosphoribosylanthranilate isomerase
MTRIKICGITNVEDARCAADAGADLIGFIFYRKSPRFVEPERAAGIAAAIREVRGAQAPRFVGVFVDEPLARVRQTIELAGLDLAQLHGSEPASEVRALYPRAFKALRPRTLDEAAAALAAYEGVLPEEDDLPQLLVDGYHPLLPGGTGVQADAAVAAWLASRVRLLLAGGLTPETVAQAIEQVRPWGVDVSSGVEAAKGIKDHAQVRAFVEAVRRAEQRNAPS